MQQADALLVSLSKAEALQAHVPITLDLSWDTSHIYSDHYDYTCASIVLLSGRHLDSLARLADRCLPHQSL